MFLFGVCRVGCRDTVLPPGSALSLEASCHSFSKVLAHVPGHIIRAGGHTRLGEARKLCFPGREKSPLLFQLLCYLLPQGPSPLMVIVEQIAGYVDGYFVT